MRGANNIGYLWDAHLLSVFLPQFVPFRDYIDRSGNQILSMARLAKDVLAEIPDQLLSFMKSKGIEPRPAPPATSMPNKPPVNMRI